MKKIIFGRSTQFIYKAELDSIMEETFSLYESSELEAEVIVKILGNLDCKKVSANPKVYGNLENGMLTDFPNASILWEKNDRKLEISISLNKVSAFREYIRKLRSMEFASEVEAFEQIIHELVLVPSAFFANELAVIHAASVEINNKAFLISGTGGVGKSSALLSMKDIDGVSFVSDDIAIVSSDGIVFGNMAWPKIYGYNCIGNDMTAQIIGGRSFIDRCHFKFKNKRDPSKVRRKIRPDKLFGSVRASGVKVSDIFLLFKKDIKEIRCEPLNIDEAIDATILIMKAEYSMFYNFLLWDEYNTNTLGKQSLLTMSSLEEKWRSVLRKFFEKSNVTLVSIPLKIDHRDYQKEIQSILFQASKEN